MKKLHKAMVLILAFSLVFSLAGCSSKTAITADKFEEIMEDEGYDVTGGSGDDFDSDFDIDEVSLATKDGDHPLVIFVDFGSLNDAKDYFKKTVDDKNDTIKDEDLDAKTTTKSSGDYEKFTEKGESEYGSDAYSVMIRIKNTILIVYTDADSSSDVKAVEDIVSKLGY